MFVVDERELIEPEVSRERGGFTSEPLHHVAVAHKRPHPMVDDLEAGPVELAREDSLRDSYSHSVADALAQRSGSRLHSGRVAALGVTGGSRTPLPKVPQ